MGSVAFGKDVSANQMTRTPQEIIDQWNKLKPKEYNMKTQEIYEEMPSLTAPFKSGKLKSVYIEDAINTVNFMRYLAGLPSDVTADWSLEEQEQAAALVNAFYGKLSHTPVQPTGMEKDMFQLGYKGTSSSNLANDNSLFNSVLSYMSDSGPSNIDRVGHRRWILNPSMKKTMFGFVDINPFAFSAMYAFSNDRTDFLYDTVKWPAEGYFPSEIFRINDAWSVSLNPNKYDKNRTGDIEVTLTRESDKRTWDLNNNNKDMSGKYFNVETNNYGIPFCIIFKPDGIEERKVGEKFTVVIKGVYDLSGSPVTIAYETTFFSLEPPVKLRKTMIKLTTGEELDIRLLHQKISNPDLTFYSINEDDSAISLKNGVVTALKPGTVSINVGNLFQPYQQLLSIYITEPQPNDQISPWAKQIYQRAKAVGLINAYFDNSYQKPINRLRFAALTVELCENLLGYSLKSGDSPFNDVTDSRIKKAYSNGLIKGTSTDKFSPNQAITREEAASLLMSIDQFLLEKLRGDLLDNTNVQKTFSDDTLIADWAKSNIYKSVNRGYIKGLEDGSFQPKGKLTNEQAYSILLNIFETFEPSI